MRCAVVLTCHGRVRPLMNLVAVHRDDHRTRGAARIFQGAGPMGCGLRAGARCDRSCRRRHPAWPRRCLPRPPSADRNPVANRNEIARPASLTAHNGRGERGPCAAREDITLIRLSRKPAAVGAIATVAALALAGCGSSSGSSSGSGSSSNSSQTSSFRQCLEKHGVTPPQGFGSGTRSPGATESPRPRPTGSTATSFRQAMQACGGSPGGGAGGAGGSAG
jgi:hypothetical protein